ncbi:MAG: hypothetical protein KC910_10295 [Candidatus Eremiobacteraeota bacterium]|nr:hypothetical protein [Candidatus Eremiobacteraeota bacterium]
MKITSSTPLLTRAPAHQPPDSKPIELPRLDRFEPSAPAPAPVEAPEPPKVGDKKTFFTWDMAVMPPGQKEITATCRAVGEDAYIFVDDTCWNRLVTDRDVFEVDRRFHREAPSGAVEPRQGVAANDHAYFGRPPLGLDGDPRAYVLITDIASFKGTTLDGYFNPFDTITDAEAQQYGQRSNEKEIVYLNAGSRRIDSDYMQAVLAHEYSHLLQHQYDGEEESWLGETLGEIAMQVNGYHTDMGHVARHQTRPDRPLVSQTYVDYGACMLFGTYLTERFGQGFIEDLTRNPLHGTASIDDSLNRLGQSERFSGLFKDWVVANYADARKVATPGLHYSTLDVPAPAETLVGPEPFSESNKLVPTGVRYYRLPEGKDVSLRVQADGPGLNAEVLEFDGPRLNRVALEDGRADLFGSGDRVLAVSSLAEGDLNYTVTIA